MKSIRIRIWRFSGAIHVAGRVLIATVWLYQGAWLKILEPSAQHLSIIRSIPYAGSGALWLMPLIGLLETGLAVWVLTGFRPVLAAYAQTLLLIAMNAGGLLWNPFLISDPALMIVRNSVFLVIVWFTARG